MQVDRGSDLTVCRRRRPAGGQVIDVAGELDIAGAVVLDAALRRLEHVGCPTIVLDLHRVRFVDCAGVRLLLAVHARLGARGIELQIIRPPAHVGRIFTLTETEHLLPFVDRASDAAGLPMWEHPIEIVGQPRGGWTVSGGRGTISEHSNLTEAERAAADYASEQGQTQVVVRDRYERVHDSRFTR